MNKYSQVLEDYKYTPKPILLIIQGSTAKHVPQLPYAVFLLKTEVCSLNDLISN